MSSILKWIWSAVRWVGKKVLTVFEALWNVLSSLLTWVIASITYLLNTLYGWVQDALSDFASFVSDVVGGSAAEAFPIATNGNLLGHLLTLFDAGGALAALTLVLGVFVIARLTRLAIVPVRALLEVL